ncbi:sulfotransferase family 2 domain-containing protein [Actibacterium ureilyticum]|uniref:sulfotransferase family 2 domain-containing protein n=1 Tax=Actibacterium ureilyticum TaxID=1590614 RepID=UPI000BAAB30B|nr:sulfotransferase family 2 domain-containing protein [Actibacterium ureilyticum]
MPIIRTNTDLIFFAHVPKCAGSAIEDYLRARFPLIAFEDNAYMRRPVEQRWNKSSPQHIDLEALNRLFPQGFFDHSFAVVRHPVARIVSAYHFQHEVERSIPESTSFVDWLRLIQDESAQRPFQYDNHVRPMTQLVPEEAQVFYLEHGLDAVIPWLDMITGDIAGPRAFTHKNKRGAYTRNAKEQVVPSDEELALIEEIYGTDFERFGYRIGQKMPDAPAPALPDSFILARDAELAARDTLSSKVKDKANRLMARLK